MAGETDLARLIAGMDPAMAPGVFVFATLPPGTAEPSGLFPLMRFREAEGVTLILERRAARAARLAAVFPCRMITLRVHSALEAVGFLAAVAARLTDAGIGANPVAGFFHDHLFVAEDRAEDALAALRAMAAEAGAGR